MNGAVIISDSQVIGELQRLRDRLRSRVLLAYDSRGAEFGRNHLSALRNKAVSISNELLPGEAKNFEEEMIIGVWSSGWDDSETEIFWKNEGALYEAYIDSLLTGIQDGEHSLLSGIGESLDKGNSLLANNKIFIIHGHDGETKEKTAHFTGRLGLEAIVLSEQTNQGKTIIEKLEHYIDVGFAIVLCTGDNAGNTEAEAGMGNLNARARQNVAFKHELLMGRLGRNRVTPLVSGALELPSDVQGVVYIDSRNWRLEVAREMRAAGYNIDTDKVL